MTLSLRLLRGLLLVGVLACLPSCIFLPQNDLRIDNPYAEATWQQTDRHKATLHVHTRRSDGRLFPHEAIDAYKALGYDVIAITDHNKVTYPWTTLNETYGEGFENRDPGALGVKDVQGNELSSHHHMTSYWTDHNGTRTETNSLEATAAKGGQTMLCHPGRYRKDVSWYVDLFSRYDHLFGMEVYNQGDRYPGDRQKWDDVLSVTMPGRPVWGLSNDDMHTKGHLGRNWNVLLTKGTTEAEIRSAFSRGQFYFVYSPKGHNGAPPPRIDRIDVDERAGVITIQASHTERIEWVSDGQVVAKGEVFDMTKARHVGSYVRAMLYGVDDGTVAGTQPFGLHMPSSRIAKENDTPPEPFTIILIPDTQYYSQKFPETYLAQTTWIKESAQKRNIKFAVHLGDLVEHAGNEEEWRVADQAHAQLDGQVPYSVLPGNHDGASGDLSLYNKYFGPSRFADQACYGGSFNPTNNAANYSRFTAGGQQWMVLSLSYDPSASELKWAAETVAKHAQDKVIVATHAYLLGRGDRGPQGRMLWDALVKQAPNICMVVCGHVPTVNHNVSPREGLGDVIEVLCDYQRAPNGGDGWLQMLRFDPVAGKVQVEAYSPLLKTYNTEPRHSYQLDFDFRR